MRSLYTSRLKFMDLKKMSKLEKKTFLRKSPHFYVNIFDGTFFFLTQDALNFFISAFNYN
jgi:hypothetical protein